MQSYHYYIRYYTGILEKLYFFVRHFRGIHPYNPFNTSFDIIHTQLAPIYRSTSPSKSQPTASDAASTPFTPLLSSRRLVRLLLSHRVCDPNLCTRLSPRWRHCTLNCMEGCCGEQSDVSSAAVYSPWHDPSSTAIEFGRGPGMPQLGRSTSRLRGSTAAHSAHAALVTSITRAHIQSACIFPL